MSDLRIDGSKITLTTTNYKNYDSNFWFENFFDPAIFRKVEMEFIPREYYINEKKKTIVLKWADDTITKVRTSKDDKFDAKYGFLIAYFQKHCGMSKTKANKYLDNLQNNLEKENKK